MDQEFSCGSAGTGVYKSISLTTLLRIAQALDVPPYKFLEFD